MKLAIPSETNQELKSIRSGHFGRAPYFTLATIENDKITSIEAVKNVEHDEVGCAGVVEFAASLGIDAILVVGMGQPPFMRFSNLGIEVYAETETPLVGDVLAKFVAGAVDKMDPQAACNHH